MLIKRLVLSASLCALLPLGTYATETVKKNYVGPTGTAIFNGKTITYENINGLAIFEGDIVLGTVAKLQAAAAQNDGAVDSVVVTGTNVRWPNRIVPYEIGTGFSATMVTRINDAIRHWETNTSINLVLRTAANAAQYPDYVRFQSGTGCSSWVGRVGGMQAITLESGCVLGSVIHEIGHAVALWHEQSREDRNSWVKINTANIQAGKEHNFNQQITDGDDHGPYDYGSIMHYGRTAFSIDGILPTIEPINPSTATIGQRTALSSRDIDTVENIYGKSQNILISSGKCLDIHSADAINKVNGGRIQTWDCLNGTNQQWILTADGYLVNQNGLCLDVHTPDYNAKINGGKVQQWACNGAINQRWSINQNGQLKSANGQCLDVHSPDLNNNGAKVQMWVCNSTAQQTWSVQSQNQRVQNYWKRAEHLNIEYGAISSSAIQTYWLSAIWQFQVTGDGYVRIRNLWKPNEYLNIETGVIRSSTIQPYWTSAHWKLVEYRDGTNPETIDGQTFRIQNRWKPDQYLHIENGVIQSGTILPQWHSALWIIN